MRSLNLDQLRTLSEVLAQGSFSAAARTLNLTQPAVSLQIRQLESRLGVKLIERFGKQAHPTAPGQDLLEHARRIFTECEAAERTMRRFREGWLGRVHVGTTLTALIYELPPILRKIRRTHPGLDLVVTNMSTRDSVERLLANTLDLALVTLPVKQPELRLTPLRAEQLLAVLPSRMKNVPDVVTPAWAARQPLVLEHERGAVHGLVMKWLAREMPLAHAPMHVGIIEASKQAVAAGLGISFAPDVSLAKPPRGTIVRPLKPAVPSTLALAEHRNKPLEPALKIVRDALIGLRDARPA
jgi:DNA-binding transcriptional LysR family regulator